MRIYTLPNFITLLNLTCGILGIWCIFRLEFTYAAWLIFASAFFDFLDGMVARLLNSSSEIGKQLDSLADVVSFGVLPSFILYKMLVDSTANLSHFSPSLQWIYLAPIIPALFSALRLAKFNIDTRQEESFIGLPTPANAILVASLALGSVFQPQFSHFFQSTWFLVLYCLLISFFLVAEIPMFSLKFKNLSWRSNTVPYLFLFLGITAVFLLKFYGLAFVFFSYIITSVALHLRKKINS